MLAFAVVGACFVLSQAAFAQQAQKLPVSQPKKAQNPTIVAEDTDLYVVEKIRNEKNKVTDQIAQKSANVAALSAAESQAEQRRDDVDHQARLFNDSPESQKLGQEAANHDAACAGKVLQPAEYNRCQSWKNSIDSQIDQHNTKFAEFHRQYDAEQEEVNRKNSDLVLERAAITKLQNYLSWLTAVDGKLNLMLKQDCKGMSGDATPEEIKHRCGNIQFDAARVDLPACTTEQCVTWDNYWKPRRTPEQAIEDYKKSGKANPTPNPLLDKISVPPPAK
jgi:hypothetical protein